MQENVFTLLEQRSTNLSSDVLLKPDLSMRAKGLLAILLLSEISGDMPSIVAASTEGRDAQMTAMKELEKAGYVVRRRVQNERGRFVGWVCIVDTAPICTDNIPTVYRDVDLDLTGARA